MGESTKADPTVGPETAPDGSGERSSAFAQLPAPGYDLRELIGKGGMGEVMAAHDLRIGREVALKRMRHDAPTGDQVERFLREARIQARLDHPAIVPVYELGVDADGRPYFTMKRLAGTTLHARISDGAPLPLLLRAFADVCLAIELAHARGVVHRDLKPANIMLGDYGEVYVLDWGVARVLDDPGERPAGAVHHVDIQTLDGDITETGALLGTAGYMPPEQLEGQPISTPGDVYALGAILFEILTREPLHPRGTGALGSTIDRPQQSPARRHPELALPPELDGACFDALAADPALRPSARSLAERVQRYLDGDRDHERRRALATEQLAEARAVMESKAPDARERAVRHASRALALDPDSPEAAAAVNQLVFEPPSQESPGLTRVLADAERAFNRVRLRRLIASLLVLLGSWALAPLAAVTNWPMLLAVSGLIVVTIVHSYVSYRRGRNRVWVGLVLSMLMLMGLTRVFGVLLVTPTVIAGAILTMATVREVANRPTVMILWVALVVLVPFGAEWLGVVPPTWRVADGSVQLISNVFDFRGRTGPIVVALDCLFMCMIAWAALGQSRARWQSERRQLTLAWHLQQMVPIRDGAGASLRIRTDAREA